MKREIKFRGISVETKEFIYGHLMRHKNFTEENFYIKEGSKNPIIWYEVRRETVGQFTGLHDKNGKEIWESDILNVPYNRIGNHIVEWHYGQWSIKGYDLKSCEVIGNVHEHKHLL